VAPEVAGVGQNKGETGALEDRGAPQREKAAWGHAALLLSFSFF